MPKVRLIDAVALKSTMEMAWMCAVDMYEACAIIDRAPTIEAAPVRHGRWNEKGHCECCGYDMRSRVNKWTNVYDIQFCPNCGARMDGGAENG